MEVVITPDLVDKLNLNLSAPDRDYKPNANRDNMQNDSVQEGIDEYRDNQYNYRNNNDTDDFTEDELLDEDGDGIPDALEESYGNNQYQNEILSADDVVNSLGESELAPPNDLNQADLQFRDSNMFLNNGITDNLDFESAPMMNPYIVNSNRRAVSDNIDYKGNDISPDLIVSNKFVRTTLPRANPVVPRQKYVKNHYFTPNSEQIRAMRESAKQAGFEYETQRMYQRKEERRRMREELEEMRRIQEENDRLPIIMPRPSKRGEFEGSIDFLGDEENNILGVREGNYDYVFGGDLYDNAGLVNPKYVNDLEDMDAVGISPSMITGFTGENRYGGYGENIYGISEEMFGIGNNDYIGGNLFNHSKSAREYKEPQISYDVNAMIFGGFSDTPKKSNSKRSKYKKRTNYLI